MFLSYKKESRTDWGLESSSRKLNHDEIKLGAILRVADAVEVMAKNHTQLQNERDYYERLLKRERAMIKQLTRSNSGLRGHIAKLKKSSKS